MEFTLKFSFVFFFLLLSAAMVQSDNGLEENVEATRQFHIDEHKDTRETLKLDMDGYFSKLWQKMVQQNAETLSKLERNQEALSKNLSREFHENMRNLYVNLTDSFNGRLTNSDLKIEGSLLNISQSLTGKFEKLNTAFHRNLQISPLVQRTAVEEVSGESGTIEFKGEPNSNLKRKIWVILPNAHHWNVSFVLEENGLGKNAHLTVWTPGKNPHVWNGSQANWRKEVMFSKTNTVLFTLSLMSNSEQTSTVIPNFRLKFNAKITSNNSEYVTSKEMIRGEGVQSVSHPPHNNKNYTRNSKFYSIVAPYSGNQFRLTLKYMDIPGTPPKCGNKWFVVYVLQESSTQSNFERLTTDSRRCGRLGYISEFVGHAEVAFVWFWSTTVEVGSGFRLEAEPSE